MDRKDTSPSCDVCGALPTPSAPLWRNATILGGDDALCRDCFEEWYEGGVTSREKMRANSLAKQEARNV